MSPVWQQRFFRPRASPHRLLRRRRRRSLPACQAPPARMAARVEASTYRNRRSRRNRLRGCCRQRRQYPWHGRRRRRCRRRRWRRGRRTTSTCGWPRQAPAARPFIPDGFAGGNAPFAPTFYLGGGGGGGGFNGNGAGTGILTNTSPLNGGEGGRAATPNPTFANVGGGGGGGGGAGGYGAIVTGRGHSSNSSTIAGGAGGAGGQGEGCKLSAAMAATAASACSSRRSAPRSPIPARSAAARAALAGTASIRAARYCRPGRRGHRRRTGFVGAGPHGHQPRHHQRRALRRRCDHRQRHHVRSGTNVLELRAGSAITGNVVAASTADTLRLGGATDATFDAGQIGAVRSTWDLASSRRPAPASGRSPTRPRPSRHGPSTPARWPSRRTAPWATRAAASP